MRRRIVVSVLLLTVGCSGGTRVPANTGIEGTVLIGPQCPVEREDEPCPDKPYAAALKVVAADGSTVATTRSGNDGAFRVAVAPGSYRIEDTDDGAMPFLKPVDVVVREGAYTKVTVSFDSGIR